LLTHLREVAATPLKHLLPARYRKFRNFGIYGGESPSSANGSEAP
jgi:hypothetical protein